MKRREFIEILSRNGWELKRRGGDHDIYTNGIGSEPVPRHTELDKDLVKAIIKRRGLR